jgi:hypothetical protein
MPIVVQCDASVLGIGGALINRTPTGDRVIKCVSHAFTTAESKWKTIEQEAFAVVFTVLFFRTVLYGHHFLVETDHRNLTFIHAGTSAKVVRWSLALQRFSFSISFIPGEKNVVADALSRAPAGAPRELNVIRLTASVLLAFQLADKTASGEVLAVRLNKVMHYVTKMFFFFVL